MSEWPEAAVSEGTGAGEPDRAAFLTFYQEAVPEVYGYFLHRCGDSTTAEDLTSETFLAAVRNLEDGRPAPLDIPWVIGVARHKLADYWRRRAREDRLRDALEQDPAPNEDPWDVRLDQLRANEVLAALGPHHRLALTLRYVDGLPVADVAELLGRTPNATEALLVRARTAYRRVYWKEKEAVMTDPFESLRRTSDAAPPRPAFVAELADRLRVELGIREGDETTVMMRTAMGDMPVQGGVPNALLDVIEDQGYAVLENALSASEVGAVRDALAPYLGEGPFGRNDFEGFRTKRVYSLPAKSRAFDRLIEDERVLDVAGGLLGPNFLLTAALAINLGPDESAQDLHYDEAFYYGLPRPRRPLSLSTLWAIDDFTADNGGTLIAPGSTHWGDGRPDPSVELVPLEMPAGSVAIYPGTLWHAGGANTTDRFRLGVSIQYVVAWARQQESYLLAVPPEMAKDVSPRLRQLLGYSIHPPFMGHVDGRHPEKTLG